MGAFRALKSLFLPRFYMSNASVTQYYDNYVERQRTTGVNLRHQLILQLALEEGLRDAARVLEIGCGIGTVTGLLARAAPNARILASDLSPASIATARDTYVDLPNVEWNVINVVSDQIAGMFDMIILPDVLEHIPEEHHAALFVRLRSILAPNGRVVIHSPDPYYSDWLRLNRPELLQVIDLALHLPKLVERIDAAGLTLVRFKRYSIWSVAPDYMALTITHPPVAGDFRERDRPRMGFWRKVRAHFARRS